MEQLLAQPHHRLHPATRFLYPGRPFTDLIAASSLAARLCRHGILAGAARNTALMALAAGLQALVIADLFGLHPNTATAWSIYAKRLDGVPRQPTGLGTRTPRGYSHDGHLIDRSTIVGHVNNWLCQPAVAPG